MDAFKNILSSAASGQNQQSGNQSGSQNQSGGSLADNLLGKVNSMAGGGKESEKNEDYLDKGEHCRSRHIPGSKRLTHPAQVSISSSSTSWAQATRATSRPSSRPKTNRSPTLSAASTSL